MNFPFRHEKTAPEGAVNILFFKGYVHDLDGDRAGKHPVVGFTASVSSAGRSIAWPFSSLRSMISL